MWLTERPHGLTSKPPAWPRSPRTGCAPGTLPLTGTRKRSRNSPVCSQNARSWLWDTFFGWVQRGGARRSRWGVRPCFPLPGPMSLRLWSAAGACSASPRGPQTCRVGCVHLLPGRRAQPQFPQQLRRPFSPRRSLGDVSCREVQSRWRRQCPRAVPLGGAFPFRVSGEAPGKHAGELRGRRGCKVDIPFDVRRPSLEDSGREPRRTRAGSLGGGVAAVVHTRKRRGWSFPRGSGLRP